MQDTRIDNRTIDIVITSYNRYNETKNSFAKVLDDPRIENIWITDDCSTDNSYQLLQYDFLHNPKVHIFRNETNLDCFRNKHKAMQNARGTWCCLWDSDNGFDKSYIDAIFAIESWNEKTMYIPEFAQPNFPALEWSGLTITKENVSQYADTHLMTNLNACNLFVNRDEYLRTWDGSVDSGTSDSIWVSYCWLRANNKILVTPNMRYDHAIPKDKSNHYNQHSHKYRMFHDSLMKKIKELK